MAHKKQQLEIAHPTAFFDIFVCLRVKLIKKQQILQHL